MANICDVFLQLRFTDQKYISIMSCPRGSFGNLAKKEFVIMLRKQRERQDETTVLNIFQDSLRKIKEVIKESYILSNYT